MAFVLSIGVACKSTKGTQTADTEMSPAASGTPQGIPPQQGFAFTDPIELPSADDHFAPNNKLDGMGIPGQGNANQDAIDAELARFSSCKRRIWDESGVNVVNEEDFTPEQVEVLMRVVDSMTLRWGYKRHYSLPLTAANVFWYDQAFDANLPLITPELADLATVPSAENNNDPVLRRLPDRVNDGYRTVQFNDVGGYFILSTSCGTILFRRAAECFSQQMVWQDRTDFDAPDQIHYLGFSEKTLRGVRWFPSTFSVSAIAQHIVFKANLATAQTLQNAGEMGLFVGEFLPFFGAWRTLLEKTVYYDPLSQPQELDEYGNPRFHRWDWVRDTTGFTTDIIIDVIPYATQSKKIRKYSKILWGLGTAGAIASSGRSIMQDGKFDVTDATRFIAMALVLRDVRANRLSKLEFVKDIQKSDMTATVLGSSGAKIRSSPHLSVDTAKQIIRTFNPDGAKTWGDVVKITGLLPDEAKAINDAYEALEGALTLSQFDLGSARAMIEPLFSGTGGTRKFLNFDYVHNLITPKADQVDALATKLEIAQISINPSTRKALIFELAADFLYDSLKPLDSAVSTKQRLISVASLDLNLTGYSSLTAEIISEFTEALDHATFRLQLEEFGHAASSLFSSSRGYSIYEATFLETGEKVPYVSQYVPRQPATVEYLNWLFEVDIDQLRNAGILQSQLTANNFRYSSAARLAEVDIYLWFKSSGFPLPESFMEAYPDIRPLADYWYTNIRR